MDIILTILVFAALAIISDRLDGKKKKGKVPQMPPAEMPNRPKPPVDSGQPQPKIIIPEIKGTPHQEKNPVMLEAAAAERNKYQAYLAEKQQRQQLEKAAYDKQQAQLREASVAAKVPRTDIRTNVILNAIAYEQILGRPRAWQQLRYRRNNLDDR